MTVRPEENSGLKASSDEVVEFEMVTECVYKGKYPECEGVIKIVTARWPKSDYEKMKGKQHISHGICNTCLKKGRSIVIAD